LLCPLFNKIRDKGRTGSSWNQGGWGREGEGGRQGEEMTQTMYVHVNKRIKKNTKKKKKRTIKH
jgi:hypothetical protein